MIVDAHQLSHYQACQRRHLLELDWYPNKWRAKSLFDRVLTRAILAISNGGDPIASAEEASTTFLEIAANPGLDLSYGANSYQIAKDWCAMLGTIPRALSKLMLLTLRPSSVVQINSTTSWRVQSPADDSGTLHRWVTVDRWNEDALAREMHSWHVFGDMAVLRAPLMLHAIEIGRMSKGRRASSWARGWRHPSMPNINGVHFKHKDGSSYSGWTPMYLAEQANITADDWVEAMWRDHAVEALVHHLTLNAPSDAVCDDTLAQILIEARRMDAAAQERGSTTWRALPMSRAACDGLVPCPFQWACYGDNTIDLEVTGLYKRREKSLERSAT